VGAGVSPFGDFRSGFAVPPASPWTVWQPGGALRVPGPGECKGGQGGQSGQRICREGMAIGAHSRRHTFCFFFSSSLSFSLCRGG